jgi:hypothetical protein
VTALFDAGTGARTVMELAGHSDLSVTTRYAHATEEAKRSAIVGAAFGSRKIVRLARGSDANGVPMKKARRSSGRTR